MTTRKRHVIVTGGSRGLGLAVVRDLLADGYRVTTCSRTSSPEITALSGPEMKWIPCRMEAADEIRAFVEAAREHAGDLPMWGLINNAGTARDGVLATLPEVDIETMIAVNLTGAITAARAFLRAKLARRGPGRIVNISSIIGSRGFTGLSAYSATKAGLDGFSRSLAREVGRLGITVNSLAPGYLDTEMSEGLSAGQRDQIVRRTPLGRLGTAADVTPVVRFLLSDEAAFVTGQTLVVDGGATC